jgi:hypothetical protein
MSWMIWRNGAAMASSDFPEQASPIPTHVDQPEEDCQDSKPTLTAGPWRAQDLGSKIPLAINTLTRRKDLLTQRLSRLEIDQRILLRQVQSGMRVVVQMLQLLRFSMIIAGVLVIVLIKPDFRIFALALAQQAVLIPIIWIGVSLAELLIDLSIDHSLNKWVKDSLVQDPSSNRYQLRATTYAKVSKGYRQTALYRVGNLHHHAGPGCGSQCAGGSRADRGGDRLSFQGSARKTQSTGS